MLEAANRLCETMNGLSWREPELPVVQNVDAEVHDGLQSIRDALVRQLYLPVQWTGVVQALASTGIIRLGECGPGKRWAERRVGKEWVRTWKTGVTPYESKKK